MGSLSKPQRREHQSRKRLGHKRVRGSGKLRHRRYLGDARRRNCRGGDSIRRYRYAGRGRWERVA